jgi:hypothetical protein
MHGTPFILKEDVRMDLARLMAGQFTEEDEAVWFPRFPYAKKELHQLNMVWKTAGAAGVQALYFDGPISARILREGAELVTQKLGPVMVRNNRIMCKESAIQFRYLPTTNQWFVFRSSARSGWQLETSPDSDLGNMILFVERSVSPLPG